MNGYRKVSIYTEGIGNDCKVMNEDGEVLNGIYSAEVNIEAGSVVTVNLTIKAAAVTAQNAAVTEVTLVCPVCLHNQDHTCNEPPRAIPILPQVQP